MNQRTIGIAYDGTLLRAVVLQTEKGKERLLRAVALPWDGEEPLAPLLAAEPALQTEPGDRAATALPLPGGYLRQLSFPFAERRKLEAALPLELAGQLPVAVEGCVVDHLEPLPLAAGGVQVTAAAVPAGTVAALVAPFDDAGVPLQVVDLLPAALAAGLAAEVGRGCAVLLSGGWGVLVAMAGGRPVDYRLLPLPAELADEERALALERELRPLLRLEEGGSLCLFGGEANEAVAVRLREVFPSLRWLETVTLDGIRLDGAYLPALALARRVAGDEHSGFNFRRGAFARQNEWLALQRRLILLAALAGAALLVLGVSAGVRWWGKAREAAGLKVELHRIYRDAVPGEGTVVDVGLQLRAKLAELTRQSRPGGQAPALAPLALLREVSQRTPQEGGIVWREWAYQAGEVRIDANAASYDAANRLVESLTASPLLKSVQLVEARAKSTGEVEIRLLLVCRDAEDLP